MRRKKAELQDVMAQFEAWRANPGGRLIPDRLWKSALRLLERYAPSTICRHLRVNPARFKQVRDTLGGVAVENARRGRARSGSSRRPPRKERQRSTAPKQVVALAPSGNGFVEFPPIGVAIRGGMQAAMPGDVQRGAGGCRLILESEAGTLTVVTTERSLVEAVCRLVVDALAEGTRT